MNLLLEMFYLLFDFVFPRQKVISFNVTISSHLNKADFLPFKLFDFGILLRNSNFTIALQKSVEENLVLYENLDSPLGCIIISLNSEK